MPGIREHDGDDYEIPPLRKPEDTDDWWRILPNMPVNPPAYDSNTQQRIGDMINTRHQLERQYQQEVNHGNSDMANAIKNAIDRIDNNLASFRGIYTGV